MVQKKKINFQKLQVLLPSIPSTYIYGKVVAVSGSKITAQIPDTKIYDQCYVQSSGNLVPAEVSSIRNQEVILSPYHHYITCKVGDLVINKRESQTIELERLTPGILLNSQAKIIQDFSQNSKNKKTYLSLQNQSPEAHKRKEIKDVFFTGINIIDELFTLGTGQRIAIISEAGTGKSTLIAKIAKNSDADINIVALIGERGREVSEFINETLGTEGLKNSILISSTSDESALSRRNAGRLSISIAEHYRDQGKNVLLLFDSLTRYARALREIGLNNGELPVREGYPNSVYSELAQLTERTGNSHLGSITAIYTVLSNKQHFQDALTEEILSLTDGHLILDKALAAKGMFPAISVTDSVSRCQSKILSTKQNKAANDTKSLLIKIREQEEMEYLGGKATTDIQQQKEFLHKRFYSN